MVGVGRRKAVAEIAVQRALRGVENIRFPNELPRSKVSGQTLAVMVALNSREPLSAPTGIWSLSRVTLHLDLQMLNLELPILFPV